jgi:glycosyltransferase involved in cell wall biosynthesis
MSDVINVFTPTTDYYDSYGIIACELARQLTRRGYYVNVLTHNTPRALANQPVDVRRIMQQPIVPALGGILLSHAHQYGYYGPQAFTGPRIAITTWESTKLPDEWAERLNEMDGVLTPSTFSARVLRAGGVVVPIAVNPEGISPGYSYAPRDDARPFTFLALGDRGLRKNLTGAASAFVKAFNHRFTVDVSQQTIQTAAPLPDDTPVRLWAYKSRDRLPGGLETGRTYRLLSTGQGRYHLVHGDRHGAVELEDEGEGELWLADMRVRLIVKRRSLPMPPTFTNANIASVCQDMTVEEMNVLFQQCDAMIFPSRGEGFGRPPREFAATGGIVIATNWSGLADDITRWADPLDAYTLEGAWGDHDAFNGLGHWAKPDTDALAALLRGVAAQSALDRNGIGRKRAAFIQETYTWDAFTTRVLQMWQMAQLKHLGAPVYA